MYDKTIAGEQRSYAIQVTNTPTLVYNLLTANDLADYESLLNTGVQIEPLQYPALNTAVRNRVPVDGYIKGITGGFNIRLSQTGVDESVALGVEYLNPVYFWLNKVWISNPTPSNCIIRVFFS